MRLLRCALLRPALQHARLCSAGKGGPPAQPKPAVKQAAQHAVATSTHFFRISNPEAFMDPNKRVSWIITGVVAAFLAARFGYALYQDDGKLFEPTPAPAPTDVAKTLPDGRWLAVLTCAPRHSRAVPAVRAGGGVPASCVPPVGRVRTPAAQGSSCVRTRAHAYAHGPTRTHTGPRVRTLRSRHAALRLAALGLGARRPLAWHTAPRTLTPQEAHEGRLHPEGLTSARRAYDERLSFRRAPRGWRRAAH